MNIRNIPTWLGLLAALYLVTACDRVYDDLSGCLGNTIVFSYLADDNREHLQEYVDDIDVFIFDVGNGALVEKHHLEGEQLLSPLEVRLPEGDYKVVAVGNALNETVIGDGAYGEASVSRPELAEKDGSAAGQAGSLRPPQRPYPPSRASKRPPKRYRLPTRADRRRTAADRRPKQGISYPRQEKAPHLRA